MQLPRRRTTTNRERKTIKLKSWESSYFSALATRVESSRCDLSFASFLSLLCHRRLIGKKAPFCYLLRFAISKWAGKPPKTLSVAHTQAANYSINIGFTVDLWPQMRRRVGWYEKERKKGKICQSQFRIKMDLMRLLCLGFGIKRLSIDCYCYRGRWRRRKADWNRGNNSFLEFDLRGLSQGEIKINISTVFSFCDSISLSRLGRHRKLT